MAKRRRLSRGRPDTKATPPSPDPAHARPAPDQEAADGILVQIKKIELTIAGEQPDSIQKLPGYEIGIAIPDWDKNRGLLDSVRKGYLAQQKLFARSP